MSNPFISISMVTFNRAHLISEAIESALNQSYGNYEIVIIDDGSTDCTREIVEGFNSDKIKYFKSETNNGRPKSRNIAIEKSVGDYILWMGDDDIIDKNILAEYGEVLKNNNSVDVIYTNVQAFDHETGKNFQLFSAEDYTDSNSRLLLNIIKGSGITDGGSLIRKSLYEKYGGYDEEYIRAQDNEFWSRIAKHAKFYKVDKVLYRYRKHSNNVSFGIFVDHSYESKTIRRILNINKIENIFVSLDWNNYKNSFNEAMFISAQGLFSFQDYYNASRYLETTDISGNEDSLILLFQCYVRMDKIDSAEKLLREAGKKYGANPALITKLSDALKKYLKIMSEIENLIEQGKYPEAQYLLEQFKTNTFETCYTAFYSGKILAAQENPGAYNYYTLAVKFNPSDKMIFEHAINSAAMPGKKSELIKMRDRLLEEIKIHENNSADNNIAPAVSVIIPTYNRPESLKEAIKSVLTQTFENHEIIVVNDYGRDVSEIINQLADKRVILLNNKNCKGPSAARNTGIKAARGKYIALLDDDDVFYPNHLETALQFLSADTHVVYTNAARKTFIKKNNSYQFVAKSFPYSIDYSRNKLLIANISPVNCFVFEKALVQKAGYFDENLQVLEDWEFWLRLSAVTEFKHIKKVTVQVNWYNDGSTLTSSKGKDFEIIRNQIYKKYEAELNKIPNTGEIVNEFNAIWKKDNSTNTPLVSIIALSYNQTDYTKMFVESVLKFTDVPFELILIDNGSEQDTVDYLKKISERENHIKVIYNKENLGFPKGINQGINRAEGCYILIANNDIIVTRSWLNRLLSVAEENYQVGLVGPISNSVSGVQIDKNAEYKTIEEMHKYARGVSSKNKGRKMFFPRVAFLCTLIKREVIDNIGGLDERFTPGNFEDDDFCLRAQMAGYKTVVAQDVFIHHFGSKSFTAQGMDKYAERLEINKQKFIDKWGADPEQIWLKGHIVKQRSYMVPLYADDVKTYYERVKELISDGDFEQAMVYINQIIAKLENEKSKNMDMDLTKIYALSEKISEKLRINKV